MSPSVTATEVSHLSLPDITVLVMKYTLHRNRLEKRERAGEARREGEGRRGEVLVLTNVSPGIVYYLFI